jgi:hypothetical protein
MSKRPPFGYLFAIGIPLVLVFTLLLVFSRFLYGLEYYSPTVRVEEYFDLIRTGQYEQAMETLHIEEDALNRSGQYVEYFKSIYGEEIRTVSYAERKLQRTEENVYIDAYINGKTTQKFVLTKTGQKKLNFFDIWDIALAEPIPRISVTVHIPTGVRFYVNEVLVDEAYQTDQQVYVIDKYKNVKDDRATVETRSYRIHDLLEGFTLSAETSSGEICEIVLMEEEDAEKTYVVKRPIPETELPTMKKIAETITKKYSEFVANDIKFYQFTPYLYKNSKLYDDLREFYNAWFTPHDAYGFEEVSFFDIEAYDDTHYTLGVEFIYYVHRFNKRFDYHVRYHVYLLKVDDQWLLAELSIE